MIDDFNREGLIAEADFSIPAIKLTRHFERLFELRGQPKVLRSDSGQKFISHHYREWVEMREDLLTMHIFASIEKLQNLSHNGCGVTTPAASTSPMGALRQCKSAYWHRQTAQPCIDALVRQAQCRTLLHATFEQRVCVVPRQGNASLGCAALDRFECILKFRIFYSTLRCCYWGITV